MTGKALGGWFRVGLDAWALGMEASAVIGLRTAKIATGGSAGAREAELMISEKVLAAIELQTQLALVPFDTSPLVRTRKTLRHYRRKVGANKRRLSK